MSMALHSLPEGRSIRFVLPIPKFPKQFKVLRAWDAMKFLSRPSENGMQESLLGCDRLYSLEGPMGERYIYKTFVEGKNTIQGNSAPYLKHTFPETYEIKIIG